MTDLSGMTPAEQWRLLNAGEKFGEHDQYWSQERQQWDTLGYIPFGAEYRGDIPVRRRIDPAPDPLEPLRWELREAYVLLTFFREVARGAMATTEIQPVVDWLNRNAGYALPVT